MFKNIAKSLFKNIANIANMCSTGEGHETPRTGYWTYYQRISKNRKTMPSS